MTLASHPSLKTIQIASPCTADWNSMVGDDRSRFCSHCERSVYNLSAMTRRDADRLLRNTDGQICTRLYRRADGTVLTEDCPAGWNALKRRVSRVAGAALSTALTLYGSAFAQTAAERPAREGQEVNANGRGDIAPSFSVYVTDPIGAVIPNAHVTFAEVVKSLAYQGQTDETGAWRLLDVPMGVYRLSVETPGFQRFVKDNVVIAGNREVEARLVLTVGTMGGPVYAEPTKHAKLPRLLRFGK